MSTPKNERPASSSKRPSKKSPQKGKGLVQDVGKLLIPFTLIAAQKGVEVINEWLKNNDKSTSIKTVKISTSDPSGKKTTSKSRPRSATMSKSSTAAKKATSKTTKKATVTKKK